MGTRARYLLLALGLTIALVGYWVGSFVLAFAGVCSTVVHSRVPAPAGHQVAYVYGGDCGAVATITSTTASIGPPGVADPRDDERAESVFHAYIAEESPHRVSNYGPRVDAQWLNDTTLVLRYSSDSRVDWAVVQIGRVTVRHDRIP